MNFLVTEAVWRKVLFPFAEPRSGDFGLLNLIFSGMTLHAFQSRRLLLHAFMTTNTLTMVGAEQPGFVQLVRVKGSVVARAALGDLLGLSRAEVGLVMAAGTERLFATYGMKDPCKGTLVR